MASQRVRLSNHGLIDYKIKQNIDKEGTPTQQVLFKYRTVDGGRAPKPKFVKPSAPNRFPNTNRILARATKKNEWRKI